MRQTDQSWSIGRIAMCVVLASGCSEPRKTEENVRNTSQAIINGDPLDDAGEPVVKVQALDYGAPNCSGFMMGPQLVMTAAHCLPSAWASLGVSYDLSQQDDWDYGPHFLRNFSINNRWYDAQVVGAAYDYDEDLIYFWTKDGHVYKKYDNTELWFAGLIGIEQDVTYPSGKGGDDLLDVAYHEGHFYAYFDDGTITRGSPTELSDVFGELNVHDRADGISGPEDVAAIEFPTNNVDNALLWYNNGRRGSVGDFGRGEAFRDLLFFDTQDDMEPSDLRAVAMDPQPYSGGPGGQTFAIWRRPEPSEFTVTKLDQESVAVEFELHPSLDAALIRVEDSLPAPDDGFVTIPEEYTPGDIMDLTPECQAFGNKVASGYEFGTPKSATMNVVGEESIESIIAIYPADGVSRFSSGDSGGVCFVRGPEDEYELVGIIKGSDGTDPLRGRLTSAPAIRDWYLAVSPELSLNNSFAQLRDEAIESTTASQIRMVFQNSSPLPIQSPTVYYYFTSEGGKTPVLEDYFTPSSHVSIESLAGNDYRLVYSFQGVTVMPGEVLPNAGGNVVSLHYSDWSNWDKSNDHSQPAGNVFESSRNLLVMDASGEIVGGALPEPLPPPGDVECEDIVVYARDSQFTEQNLVTPRWYLKNNGDSTLSDFKVRYHFTTENGGVPLLEDYYSPGCALSLTQVGGNQWYAECNYAGTSLPPGAIEPSVDGIAFSLHYGNWSSWDKTNDASNPGSQSFVTTAALSIVLSDGTLLCEPTE